MRCEDVTELLSGYLDNTLDQDERSWTEDHLRHCPHCASELATLRATLALVQQLDEVVPPADFRVNLKQRILAEQRKERLGFLGRARRALVTAPYRGVVAVAATLAIAVGVSAGIQSPAAIDWLGLAKPTPSALVGQAGNEGAKGPDSMQARSAEPTADKALSGVVTVKPDANTGTATPNTTPSSVTDATNQGTGNKGTAGGVTTTENGSQEGATTADAKGKLTAPSGQFQLAEASEGTSGAAQPKAGAGLPQDLLAILRPAVGKSAALALEVRNVDDAVLKISQLAEKDGGQGAGYVEESTTATDANGQKRALVRFKVPAAALQDTLAQVEKMGVVRSKSVTGRETSADYSDAEARLKIYKQQESRYMEILARAKAVEEVVRLENELAVVRTNIELLQGRLDLLKNGIVYSSVSVELSQSATAAAAPPAGGTLGQAGQEAGKSFLLTSRGLGVLTVRTAGLLGGAAPVLILIGLGWLAYVIYLRAKPERARGRG